MARTRSDSGTSAAGSDPGKKKDGSVNKSAAIREMVEKHPDAESKEIVAMLAKEGIRVKPTLVYYTRSSMRNQKKRQKRQRVLETSRKTGSADPVALVLNVKRLASEAGGIRHLKQLVDALAE
jgi:hypothetical protein